MRKDRPNENRWGEKKHTEVTLLVSSPSSSVPVGLSGDVRSKTSLMNSGAAQKRPISGGRKTSSQEPLITSEEGESGGFEEGQADAGGESAVDGGGGMWASSAAWQEWKVGDWLLCKSITTTPEGWYIRAGWPPRSQSPPLALAGDQRKQVCLFCSARLLLFRKALYLQVCLSFTANGALYSGMSLKMSDQHEDEGILGYTAAGQRPQIIQGWYYFLETPLSNILSKWLKRSCQRCGITARKYKAFLCEVWVGCADLHLRWFGNSIDRRCKCKCEWFFSSFWSCNKLGHLSTV